MPRSTFWLTLLTTLIFLAAAPARAELSPEDQKHYRQAFHALDAGRTGAAIAAAKRAGSPLLRKVILAETITSPNDPYSFEQIIDFIEKNRVWPDRKSLLLAAEEKLTDAVPATVRANWFTAHQPITMFAFAHAAAALNSTGETARALNMIRERWIDGDFTRDELQFFTERYLRQMRPVDHWARTDRLLRDKKFDDATRMRDFLPEGQRALTRARIALAQDQRNAPEYASAVPEPLRHDAGLILEMLRWARRHDRNAEAVALLQNQPATPADAESWWNERQIQARRALVDRDIPRAYQLARDHRLQEGLPMTQAEFLAGWIALRLQHKPQIAIQHFTQMYEASTYPISRARGAYWLGRAYDAQNDPAQSASWYAKAKEYPATYYGQLALAEAQTPMLSTAEPTISDAARQKFRQHELIRIARALRQIGELKRFGQFILARADHATTREEFIQLAELAGQSGRPDIAVKIAKRATQNRQIISGSGFPVPDYPLTGTPDKALVLALMRQESTFTPDIVSPAGARGLMQLMPTTARAVARKEGVIFQNKKLSDPRYNIRLGSAYLAHLLKQFNGSIILAVAAYNAGPSRVKGWIEQYGDPRLRADPIDWIEIIPIYETRNYVQRVIEGMQIYRAQLNKGRAKLRILDDLRVTQAD
ncbi:MAG: lytic transglycosylase domain-containing protein [Alphaproteobacteria bacterium]